MWAVKQKPKTKCFIAHNNNNKKVHSMQGLQQKSFAPTITGQPIENALLTIVSQQSKCCRYCLVQRR
jgi:hypothetical protein